MTKNNKENGVVYSLTEIARQKRDLRINLNRSKERIADIWQELLTPMDTAPGISGLWQNIGMGVTLFDGLRTGYKTIRRMRGVFKKKK